MDFQFYSGHPVHVCLIGIDSNEENGILYYVVHLICGSTLFIKGYTR